MCQKELNQLTDAVDSFQKAINNSKKRTSKGLYSYRLGDVYLKLKRYNDAETAFQNALKYSRSQSIKGGANFGLGEVYKSLNQYSRAIQYYEKAAANRTWKAAAEYEIDAIRNPN